jgi:signal transduction histidine kinase
MEDLSLHILDIVENSLRANARNVAVTLTRSEKDDTLILEVTDDGEGMNEETLRQSIDPFFTTKGGKKVGFGLAFLAQAAEEADGKLQVESAKGRGTKVIATFKLSHIDRKPLGNIEETVRCLRQTHPDVHFRFEYLNTGGER